MQVLEEVEEQCREERVPMLVLDKAKLLASCVEKAKPLVRHTAPPFIWKLLIKGHNL